MLLWLGRHGVRMAALRVGFVPAWGAFVKSRLAHEMANAAPASMRRCAADKAA
jgi:hypothetical protein